METDPRRYGLITNNLTPLTPLRLADEKNWVVFCFETRWAHLWQDPMMSKFGHYLKEYRRMSFVAVPVQYRDMCVHFLEDTLHYAHWTVMPTYGAWVERVECN